MRNQKVGGGGAHLPWFTPPFGLLRPCLTWLYFYLRISIRIFCTLFFCFVLNGLLHWYLTCILIKNMRNIHTVLTNQIANILHFNDKSLILKYPSNSMTNWNFARSFQPLEICTIRVTINFAESWKNQFAVLKERNSWIWGGYLNYLKSGNKQMMQLKVILKY